MRLIRGTINAILVATLVKPMARWTVARWRRRAREYAEETFVMPAQELYETTIAPLLCAWMGCGLWAPPWSGSGKKTGWCRWT